MLIACALTLAALVANVPAPPAPEAPVPAVSATAPPAKALTPSPVTPPAADLPLTLAEVQGLAAAGLGDATLVALLKDRGLAVRLSVPEILALRTSGLSDAALAALVRASTPRRSLEGLDVAVKDGALIVSNAPRPEQAAGAAGTRTLPPTMRRQPAPGRALRAAPSRTARSPEPRARRTTSQAVRELPPVDEPERETELAELTKEDVAAAVREELARQPLPRDSAPPAAAPVIVSSPPTTVVVAAPEQVRYVQVPVPIYVRDVVPTPALPPGPSWNGDDANRDGLRDHFGRIPIRTSHGVIWIPN